MVNTSARLNIKHRKKNGLVFAAAWLRSNLVCRRTRYNQTDQHGLRRKGRLWVTQSSEYPVAAGPSGGNDRITILEDTNGDGRADKINDFANDLNIPIGIMPVKGGAIGHSIPNVYRFYDTDNDGKADKREVC
jgi:glucose/arabinose dehydrogenase